MSKKVYTSLTIASLLFSTTLMAETPKLQKEFEIAKQKEHSNFYEEPNSSDAPLQTTKTSCIQQSVYAGKTLEEQKKILIEQAKQESLEELYGTLILTSTDLKNGKITNDEIKTRAVGSVRVKGDPKFYNGQNLGEICANVTSYITKEDLEKYTPKEVKLKNFCFSDSSVAIKEVKNKARESAYKEMLMQFKPALKTLSKEEAEKYIHGFKESNGNFDFDKGAYCFDAVGTVLPYELEIQNFPVDNSKDKTIIAKKATVTSCKDIKEINKNAQSGYYDIEINKKKYNVYCEMRIDNGGWTQVWKSDNQNYNTTLFDYNVPISIIDNSTETFIAFESANNRIRDPYKFLTPKEWKMSNPLTYASERLKIDTTELFTEKSFNNKILMFGYEDFSRMCDDSFFMNSSRHGKICIAGTKAPFYTGFTSSKEDTCTNSSQAWDEQKCGNNFSFVIYMR